MHDDTRKAAEQIARESPEAAGLMVAYMERSADELQSLQDSLYQGMEAERDRWRERALRAERRLAAAQFRLWRLFDDAEEAEER